MKNFIKLFLLSIIALCVIGCVNPANNSNGDDKKKPVDTTELKKALYNKILGTWELEEGDQSDSGYETIVFSSDSITFNGEKKSFEPNKNLFFADEVPEEKNLRGYGTIYIDVDGLTAIVFDTSLSNVDSLELGKVFYSEISNRWTALPDDFVRVSGGSSDSGSGEGLDFSVVGDWSYTIAAGNTKTTFSIEDDGTFSFTKNNDVTNGTYSLSGNKITFKFTKDVVETEDTFIISGSEDEITLTLVESKTVTNGQTQTGTAISNMLLAFYTTTETSITLTK
ncbi:MAG: hypothetical protein J6R03_04010 [Treponema sp.]|nr:hypothetical protein [Treponema sp.]